MEFLSDKDGVLSLKKLSQVKGGSKHTLTPALSEFIRQTWSEYSFVAIYSLHLTLVSKNNQAEKIRLPGQTSGINQIN